jgi:hypothetical protein
MNLQSRLECEIIASVIANSEIPEIANQIQTHHFTTPECAIAWDRIRRLAASNVPLRLESITSALEAVKDWPKKSGDALSWLVEATAHTPTPEDLAQAVKKVIARWHQDAMKRAAKRYSRALQEGDRKSAADYERQLAELRTSLTSERTIALGTDEHRVVDETIGAIAASKVDLFQRNQELAGVIPSTPDAAPKNVRMDEGTLIVRPLSPSSLRYSITRVCSFIGYDGRSDDFKEKHPPGWLIQQVHGLGHWKGIRPLYGVSTSPLIDRAGDIVCTPGYSESTGFYLSKVPAVSVPTRPTMEDVVAARDLLFDLVCDFEFRDEASRASWLALLLTILARPAIDGPTPLFLSTANIRGAGKTKLIDLVSLIALGVTAPCHRYQPNRDECEKALVSIALLGLPLINWDNVSTGIGGDPLDLWLTSTTPIARILGSNKTAAFDWRTVMAATVNNAEIVGDVDRRAIYCDQLVDSEFPERRSGWRHDPVTTQAAEHRSEYLGAALTILRAHAVAGRPEDGGRPKGSYESWCSVVRDALLYAGCPDVERDQDDPIKPPDTDRETLGRLVAALEGAFGLDSQFAVRDVLDVAVEDRDLSDALDAIPRRAKKLSAVKCGKLLHKYCNRTIAGKRISYMKDNVRNLSLYSVKNM